MPTARRPGRRPCAMPSRSSPTDDTSPMNVRPGTATATVSPRCMHSRATSSKRAVVLPLLRTRRGPTAPRRHATPLGRRGDRAARRRRPDRPCGLFEQISAVCRTALPARRSRLPDDGRRLAFPDAVLPPYVRRARVVHRRVPASRRCGSSTSTARAAVELADRSRRRYVQHLHFKYGPLNDQAGPEPDRHQQVPDPPAEARRLDRRVQAQPQARRTAPRRRST